MSIDQREPHPHYIPIAYTSSSGFIEILSPTPPSSSAKMPSDRYIPSPTLSYYTSAFIPPTPAAGSVGSGAAPFHLLRPRSPRSGDGSNNASPSSLPGGLATTKRKKPPPSPLNLDSSTSNGVSSSYARPQVYQEDDQDRFAAPTLRLPPRQEPRSAVAVVAAPSPEFIEIEPGHRYPSWMGGRDYVPPAESTASRYRPSPLSSAHHAASSRQMYEEDVDSPLERHIGELRAGSIKMKSRRYKRQTLIDRATALLQQKRMRYMDEENAGRHDKHDDSKHLIELERLPNKGSYASIGDRRSAGRRGGGGGTIRRLLGLQRQRHILLTEKESKKQKWRRCILFAIILLIVAASITVGACVSTLGHDKSDQNSDADSTGATATSDPTASTGTATVSSASPSSTAVAYTLASCLDLYAKSAPSAPLTYPCDACLPFLRNATNDFSSSSGSASTGVGSALQFCALQSLHASVKDTDGLTGWMNNASPCNGWSGITCDDLGRINGLTLIYPSVPTSLDASLSGLVSLKSFKLIGNTATPSGTLPAALFALSNLTNIDIESTSLTGLSTQSFDKLTQLTSLVLSSNAKLGTSLPSLSAAKGLLTLAVTGQSLNSVDTTSLPSSLTYLDLSYNSLSGQFADLTLLSSLTTLYLNYNSFTGVSDTSTFPSSLQTLSLASNSNLSGQLPASLCSSSTLATCDMRNTALGASMQTNGSVTSYQTYTKTAQQVYATTIAGSGVMLVTTTTSSPATSTYVNAATASASCGPCIF